MPGVLCSVKATTGRRTAARPGRGVTPARSATCLPSGGLRYIPPGKGGAHGYRESSAFSPLEKAVLEYADRMTCTPVAVRDEDVRALRQHLDEPQLVELTAAIAHENLRARLNHALGYGAEGFTAGAYCVLAA